MQVSKRWLVFACTSLAACGGGGGGGGSAAVAPTNFSYPDGFLTYVVEVAHPAIAPTVQGSVTSWTITPSLPPGLVLASTDGSISGLPAAAAAHTTYTVRAANSGGFAETQVDISVAEPARFAYLTSRDDSTISILAAESGTGRLLHKGFAVAPAGQGAPERFVAHPHLDFGYSPDLANKITRWAIDPASGWISAEAATACGSGPHAMVITGDGRFAYVASQGSNELAAFAIDNVTGALTPIGPALGTGPAPSALAVDASGSFVFLTLRGAPGTGVGSAVKAYRVQADGSLVSAGPTLNLNGSQPVGVRVDPRLAVVFVVLEGIDAVLPLAFDAATGVLASLGGFNTGDGPSELAVQANGRFAYVANRLGNSVSCFAVDLHTGVLTLVATTPTDSAPQMVELDPTGRFAYVVCTGAKDVQLFDVDPLTGALALREALSARGVPTDLAFVHGAHALKFTPRFVHCAASSSGDVTSYMISPQTGALTLGPQANAGDGTAAVTLDPRLHFAFTANAVAGTIGRYTVAPTNGALSELVPAQPLAGRPSAVSVDPAGRFVYAVASDVIAPADGWLTTYKLDGATGELTQVDTREIGFRPSWVGFEPAGEFLYLANSGNGGLNTGSIWTFQPDVITGIPLGLASTLQVPGAFRITFHPGGRHLYVALRTADVTVEFDANPSNGALTLTPANVRAGLEPMAIALTPDGRFGYVAYRNTPGQGHVGFFRIEPSTGALMPPAELFTDGMHPSDLAVDPTGRFLYVANSGSDTVSVYLIDQTTGLLTATTPVPAGVAPSAIVVSGTTQ